MQIYGNITKNPTKVTELAPRMIYGGGKCYYICIVPVKERSLTHTIQIFFLAGFFSEIPLSFESYFSVLFECLGKSSFACFLIKGRDVVSSLFHYPYRLVEGYAVLSVSVQGIDAGIKSSGCSICVSFDAGNLYKSADRVAGKSQMMLKAHLGCIFDL